MSLQLDIILPVKEKHRQCIIPTFIPVHEEQCALASSEYVALFCALQVVGSDLFNPFTARVDDGVCEVVLTFTSVDKILWCDHLNETSLEVLSCGVICFKKFYKMKFGIFVEFAFGHIWQ